MACGTLSRQSSTSGSTRATHSPLPSSEMNFIMSPLDLTRSVSVPCQRAHCSPLSSPKQPQSSPSTASTATRFFCLSKRSSIRIKSPQQNVLTSGSESPPELSRPIRRNTRKKLRKLNIPELSQGPAVVISNTVTGHSSQSGSIIKSLQLPMDANSFADFAATGERRYGTEIVAGKIYLGGLTEASNPEYLAAHKITAIITVMLTPLSEGYIKTVGVDYLHIEAADVVTTNLAQHFEKCIEFIGNEQTVLIHCQAGVSRSSAVCAAYLIHKNCWSAKEAIEFLESRRKCVAPNFSFLGQLAMFEQQCKGKNS